MIAWNMQTKGQFQDVGSPVLRHVYQTGWKITNAEIETCGVCTLAAIYSYF